MIFSMGNALIHLRKVTLKDAIGIRGLKLRLNITGYPNHTGQNPSLDKKPSN